MAQVERCPGCQKLSLAQEAAKGDGVYVVLKPTPRREVPRAQP